MCKYLKAVDIESTDEGMVITEDNVVGLERAKEETGLWRNRKSPPAYLGGQDTYYVGSLKA